MRYLFLVILWIAWCALHSALVSLPLTESLRRRFPNGFRTYRILYNLFAAVTLIPVLLYGFSLKTAPIIAWQGPWRIVPFVLIMVALFLLWSGARRYDLLQFVGLRQIKDEKTCSVLTDDCTLDTGGVLSMVRHPWYTAGLLIVWARPLDMSALLTNVMVCGYLVIGAILEERKLKIQFGQEYKSYQQQVSMFFPIKWAKKALFQKI